MPDGAAISGRARALMQAARPRDAAGHVAGGTLLVAETAQMFGLGAAQAARLTAAFESGQGDATLARLGLEAPVPRVDPAGPVRAIALTVAQSCNMACSYCYASGGDFGAPSRAMQWPVVEAAIDQLIASAPPGGAVKIAFMGGEPLVSRRLIRDAVAFANRRAGARAVLVGFSITTNGTLVTEEDAAFFADHRFAVTVSMDGGRAAQDLLRPMRGGGGSFDRIARRLAPLIAHSDRIALSARVTATPDNLDITGAVADLGALGFRSVGVSPLIASANGQGTLEAAGFEALLDAITEAGDQWLAETIAGRHHPFANLATALGELHRGKARSHACGAARDYLAVDAQGNYAACHRFVNDPAGAMGDLTGGIDHDGRAAWVAERAVTRQEPCRSCWARALCGGGCHHEVIHRGRPACDYVRGWLHYAIGAHAQMLEQRPDWFDARG